MPLVAVLKPGMNRAGAEVYLQIQLVNSAQSKPEVLADVIALLNLQVGGHHPGTSRGNDAAYRPLHAAIGDQHGVQQSVFVHIAATSGGKVPVEMAKRVGLVGKFSQNRDIHKLP